MGRYTLLSIDANGISTYASIDQIVAGQAKLIEIGTWQMEYFEEDYTVIQKGRPKAKFFPNSNGQPMVIIGKIKNKKYICLDASGKIQECNKEDVFNYYNNGGGIANATVRKRAGSGTIVIRGDNWTIPDITQDQLDEMKKPRSNTMPTGNNLFNYIQKAALLGIKVNIDYDNSILLNYESKQVGLQLPPVNIIGWYALNEVKADEIIIPSTVKIIKRGAFMDVTTRQLTINDDIEIVEEGSCEGEYGLYFDEIEKVYIGDNFSNSWVLKRICQCNDIAHIEVSPNNPNFVSIDDVVYTKDIKHIVAYPSGRKARKFVMPDSVEGTLEPGIFYSAHNLESLIISHKIECIMTHAINNCYLLRTIELGKDIKFIYPAAIHYCDQLKKIIVNSNIELKPNVHFVARYEEYKKQLENVQIIYNGKKPHQFI